MTDAAFTPPGHIATTRRRVLQLGLGTAIALAAAHATRPASGADPMTRKWICTAADCPGHIYDPQEGDPTQGIPAGTPFEDLPDDWYCPDCGAAKIEYVPYGW